MKKVVIINRVLKNYRARLYSLLKGPLLSAGIELIVVHGREGRLEALKKDSGLLEWAVEINNVYLPLGFLWQRVPGKILEADLIIVEQASKFLLNYVLLLRRFLSNKKIAFIGHGLTRIKPRKSLSNSFKSALLRNVDWWFAYTEGVSDFIESKGYPRERITVIQNSIDTRALIKDKESQTEQDINKLRKNIALEGGPVGIFCGGMYSHKRIPFLIDACKKIRNSLADFEMIFLGSGPQGCLIEREAKKNKWMHYIGPCFGRDKAAYFMLADIFLMPGLVGLCVLDSFVFEKPIVTTSYPYHSPEIEYLKNGINGVITEDNINSYVKSVTDMLSDKKKIDNLKAGCKDSSQKYTIEEMAERFKTGIINCLK
ncbi:MAG: glycosyltransferase family 4 protein [Candidatus Omnitrophota bacterium]